MKEIKKIPQLQEGEALITKNLIMEENLIEEEEQNIERDE